jgi:hypothetical protein
VFLAVRKFIGPWTETDVPTGMHDGTWGNLVYTAAVSARVGTVALVACGVPQSTP